MANNTRHLLTDLSHDESRYIVENILFKICEHLDEEELIDVTFKLSNPDAMIKAHRLVLSAASPFFKEIFKSVKGEDSIIDIDDIDSVTFKRVINFCYTGKLLITLENVHLTLKAATILQLERPVTNCIEFVMKNIQDYTLAKAYVLADETKCAVLEQKLIEYEIRILLTMVDNPEFGNYDLGTLLQVIKNDERNTQGNRDILGALSRWYATGPPPKGSSPSFKNWTRITQFNSDFFFANTRPLQCCVNGEQICWVHHPSNRAPMTLKLKRLDKASVGEKLLLALNISDSKSTGAMLLYNKIEDSWKEWTKIQIDLRLFQVVFKDNELIFIGGSRNDKPVGEVRSWNFKNKTFKILASLNVPRYSHTVVLLNNNIYVMGGKVANDTTSSLVEMYCAVSNRWIPVKSMIAPRQNAGVVAVNGKIFVMGGMTDKIEYNHVECYDPTTNSWNPCLPLNATHAYPGAAVHNGNIFVVGGYNEKSWSVVERYTLNGWAVMHPLVIGRLGPACFTFDNQLWAVGGCSNGSVDCVEVFDEQNNQWIEKNRIPLNGRYCCFIVPKTLLE